MRIEQLNIREIRLPLREAFVSSAGRVEVRRLILLTAWNEDGRQGWSECVALERPDYVPETVDTAWIAIGEWLAPRLVGHEIAEPRHAHEVLHQGIRGHAMARGAVEMVVWDLFARCRGVSLAELLGGERGFVDSGVVVGLQESLEATLAAARGAVAAGYRRIKLKVRRGFDLEPVAAVAELLRAEAPTVALVMDANSAYTLEDLEHLRRFDAFGLQMIEQPLHWDDLTDHAELQRHLETPVCLDESVRGVTAARQMLTLGSGRVLNLKPGRVGGLTAALEIHRLCREQGVDLWCGGMLESGIGRAYNVALASLPGFTLPGDLSPSRRYWDRDIVDPEWTMDESGKVTVPRAVPGIGVTVDEDRVEDLTVRRRTLRAP
ncbi:MAG: o-succinylbenzoate synthase [Acidobacteriota bacterium]|nr:o-succinylbenzoate synthase [Acidobacteriota bacterium]